MNKSPNEPADMIDSDDSSNSEYRLMYQQYLITYYVINYVPIVV